MDWCHWGVISGLEHNAVLCYANKTMYKEQKMSSERQFSSSDWCEWVIWRNTSGLFRNPQIANKSLLVTVTTESESEDEEYDLTNDSQNEERTGSNRVASHSCSSGASAQMLFQFLKLQLNKKVLLLSNEPASLCHSGA